MKVSKQTWGTIAKLGEAVGMKWMVERCTLKRSSARRIDTLSLLMRCITRRRLIRVQASRGEFVRVLAKSVMVRQE